MFGYHTRYEIAQFLAKLGNTPIAEIFSAIGTRAVISNIRDSHGNYFDVWANISLRHGGYFYHDCYPIE